ncbi:MAG TPA: cytidylate kinase-like family protein [Gaiellaceae bacterium]|nr:cytidylate kinase-like family protein [Gaiellaceae bacterium]
MKTSVVCVSHATGAGGNEVGRLVAERLGFRYVDEDLVSQAALRAGVDASEIADEERRKSWLGRVLDDLAVGGGEAWAMTGLGPYGAVGVATTSDELRAYIREAIEETAGHGKAVIVAHAASHALAGRQETLRVLVTASPATRAGRVAEAEGLDETRAARTIKDADAGRADYLRRFHGVEQELPTQYDLVLNTDQLSPEQAAALISEAALI